MSSPEVGRPPGPRTAPSRPSPCRSRAGARARRSPCPARARSPCSAAIAVTSSVARAAMGVELGTAIALTRAPVDRYPVVLVLDPDPARHAGSELVTDGLDRRSPALRPGGGASTRPSVSLSSSPCRPMARSGDRYSVELEPARRGTAPGGPRPRRRRPASRRARGGPGPRPAAGGRHRGRGRSGRSSRRSRTAAPCGPALRARSSMAESSLLLRTCAPSALPARGAGALNEAGARRLGHPRNGRAGALSSRRRMRWTTSGS